MFGIFETLVIKMDLKFEPYFKVEPIPETQHQIKVLIEFFSDPSVFLEYFQIRPGKPYPKEFGLNFQKLIRDSSSTIELTQILTTIRYNPETFLPSLHVVVHTLISRNVRPDIEGIRVFICKYDIITPLSSIRSSLIQRFVCISGNVVKVYPRKPFVISMGFTCIKCKMEFEIEFPDGKFAYPKICRSPDCKNFKMFIPDKSTAVCIDHQRIKVQENSNDEQSGVPLTIDCESRGLNISDISVGDPVTVMGIVKAESSDLYKNKNTGLYGLYLEISSISSIKESQFQIEEFSEEEISKFQAISRTTNIFPLLVKKFCSLIYGLEKVKAGLLLAILGGSENQSRSTSHILIVGDPGLGKTQLLRTAVNFSMRGIYVSATTRTGLTVNVTREGGQNLMRAGALIMADDGLCAIDEFDKMGKDQMAMLEVMEQQTITVAKSGVYCSLKARATVVAAANSAGGHYNPGKSLVDNLKISAAVLSRFDLIFLLLDNHDSEVSKHVISMHNNGKRKYSEAFKQLNLDFKVKRSQTQSRFNTQRTSNDVPFDEESYTSFLQRAESESFQDIDSETIKRYLAFARDKCQPKLSPEAIEVINEYYMMMRKEQHIGSLTITTRQLESLRRLTEARAKAELREIANENDAVEVIKLYQETVFDMKFNEVNHRGDKARPQVDEHIGQKSIPKQQAAYVEKLQDLARDRGSIEFSFKEMHQVAKEMGLRVGDFTLFIEKLNMSNYLLKKGPGMYRLMDYL
jgi:DNA helicase MCM8